MEATKQELAAFDSWDSLAIWIESETEHLDGLKRKYLRGGLAVGAAICMFAERPEVARDVDKANADRRGRPWTPVRFVAVKLEEKYGKKVPSATWMGNCARAAVMARQKGIEFKDVGAILGWKNGIDAVPASIRLGEVDPARLLNPPKDGEGSGNEEELELEDYISALADTFAGRLQKAVVLSQTQKKRLSPALVKPLIEKLNPQLQYLGLAIAPLPEGKRKRGH